MRNVPKLRFKEFNGDWEEKKLEEIGIIGRGKSKHRPRDDKKLFGGKYPFIQTGDIKNAGLFLNNYTQTYSDFGLEQSKLWKAGTLCITIAANIAETSILNIDACFPDSIIGVNVFTDKANNIFLKMYFDFKRRDFEKISEGLAQSNLNLDKLKSMFFKIPIIKEQQKIANFLSSVDKKISITEEKLDLFKEYKKGIMQKIFNQELRFKDSNGNDYPEWEEKKLDDIMKVSSSTISQNTLEDNQGEYIIYGATGEIKKIDFYDKEKEYIGIVKDGAGVGRCFYCKEKSSVLATLNYLDIKENNNLKFCYYILNKIDFTKYIVGSSIPHIYFKDYKFEKIQLPCLEEQEKIADFLSSIDNKIDNLATELEDLKEFKKGLLQQMFV